MKALRFIFIPVAIIYWFITTIRNGFYNWGIFKSSSFNLPIISVGNLSMGGTGKTPLTEYIIRLLKEEQNIATLSRGYGRREYGFKIADENSSAMTVGDEPLQYYRKFGNEIKVAVEANRVMGVMDLCRENPETDVVILDDAFQHRAIHRGLNILVTPYDKPFYKDWIVPIGELRESRAGKKRAGIIVVSKCPDFNKIDKEAIITKLKLTSSQKVFFSKINYGKICAIEKPESIAELNGRKIILVTGIGNPSHLVDHVKKSNTILHHFKFSDHYKFKAIDLQEIHNLFDKFASENPVILTTEKDAMRLLDVQYKSILKDKPWFYQTIVVEMDKKHEFDEIILEYVKKNN